MWYHFLIFLFLFILVYPFFIRTEIKFNVLRFKGSFILILFNKFKIEFKFRIKNGYIYIYHKGKEHKEQLTNKNINIIFIKQFVKHSYFRIQLLKICFVSSFGFVHNSAITATGCGYIDCLSKCVLAKVKNNKKSAHIFTLVNPKYNEDICNVKLSVDVRLSIFDVLFTLIYAWIYSRREYEKNRKSKLERKEKTGVID